MGRKENYTSLKTLIFIFTFTYSKFFLQEMLSFNVAVCVGCVTSFFSNLKKIYFFFLPP